MASNRSARERTEINHYLMRHGLGGLTDPNLIHQLAFLVRNHDHFRQLLVVQEPQHRHDMYEAMRPHLRFQAKPLDVYIAEAAANFAAAESRAKPLEVEAEEALAAARAKGWMEFTCARCTRTESYPGMDRLAAIKAARKAGWVYERRTFTDKDGKVQVKEREICPRCPASSRAN